MSDEDLNAKVVIEAHVFCPFCKTQRSWETLTDGKTQIVKYANDGLVRMPGRSHNVCDAIMAAQFVAWKDVREAIAEALPPPPPPRRRIRDEARRRLTNAWLALWED